MGPLGPLNANEGLKKFDLKPELQNLIKTKFEIRTVNF
jgi:hypothetical protein